jgi:hypothetical protein
MADAFATFARILKATASRYGGRVGICNIHDDNVCTSALDWQANEVTPPPDRFVRHVKFQYSGRRVAIRSNNEFVKIELSADLAGGLVFSVNRADQIMLTEPSELRAGQHLPVFVCSDTSLASVASALRTPAVQRAIEALELGPDESLHVYQNEIAAYIRPKSEHRLEVVLTGLATLIQHLPPAEAACLELKDLPNKFHSLLPLIQKWRQTDDEEREEKLSRATTTELRELVTNVEPHFAAINRYLDRFDGVPMPLSAIALGALAESAAEAALLLGPATKGQADPRAGT